MTLNGALGHREWSEGPVAWLRKHRVRPRARVAIALSTLAFATLTATSATAGPISVTPTSVTLAPGKTTELVSLLNEGDSLARFEVTISSWSESETGKTDLAATKDLIVFPPLLEIAPHASKNIRIGAATGFTPAERSYRLVVQELPSAEARAGQVQIQVLTKISLPVFMTSPGAAATARIAETRLADGTLRFVVINPGTAHFVLRRIEVTGQGGAGPSFTIGADGWYMLAGGRRIYQVALARSDCEKTNRLVIKAVGDGPTAESTVPVAAAACGGATATRFIEASQDRAAPAQ